MEKLKIFDAKLYASGAPLVAGQTGVAVFGMIFGTFFAVIVVFILLYVFYVGPLKDYNFTTRYWLKYFIEGKLFSKRMLTTHKTMIQRIFRYYLTLPLFGKLKKLIDYFTTFKLNYYFFIGYHLDL